ncbi:MAG TPA: FAD-dependent oxidoreductase [Rectinemataceae bacterium]|nr:FAD-dependent oxidoreductase [Rectinemataceae bacterium]
MTKVAFERIPACIVETQSLKVDSVTGATLASNGIKNAVADAAKKAGFDVAALRAKEVKVTPKALQTWDTDVLVIGAGGTGLSAALSAAQTGVKVILIEKGSMIGGNTMMAGAVYNAVDPEAQSTMKLTKAQKSSMDAYLALDPADPSLMFDRYPEWKPVLLNSLRQTSRVSSPRSRTRRLCQHLPRSSLLEWGFCFIVDGCLFTYSV